MSNNLPKHLSEKQELLRQQTINRVLHAITAIQAVGGMVTITALVERTGLSRSVFAKPHIKAVLIEYGYSTPDTVSVRKNRPTRTKKQAGIGGEKDVRIAQLQAKNIELEQECEFLRGQLFLLMQRQHES